MIAVIFLFQLPQRFLFSHFLRNGKPFYIFMHLLQHFFLSDTTNGSVWFQHTDIRDIVQSAGHAELRELGDTGQENKAQIRVASLQRTVKNYASHYEVRGDSLPHETHPARARHTRQ